MRKFIVISILSILIVQSVSYAQLSKVPAFVSHYITHKVIHNIDLSDFIAMHYLGHDIDDDDYEDDMKLPFKTVDAHVGTIYCIPQEPIIYLSPTIHYLTKVDYPLYALTHWSNPMLDNIHRPPCC